MKLNLGCGRHILEGWTNLDRAELPGVDVVADLEVGRLPFADDSVSEMLLAHVIEHIRDPLRMMQELHRIARPGCKLDVYTPHGATDVADEDPTHYRRMFPTSFVYFGQPAYWRADYGYRGDWDCQRVLCEVSRARYEHLLSQPTKIYEDVRSMRNVVKTMHAELVAVKPIRGPDPQGTVPRINLAFYLSDVDPY